MESYLMKIFAKGQVVIPAFLRQKYGIEPGDVIDVIGMDEGILLKPKVKKRGKNTNTDQLFGVFADYANTQKFPKESEIDKAFEAGLVEDWDKP